MIGTTNPMDNTTKHSGSILDLFKYTYDPNNPFTFTGYQTDGVTNMQYAQARYYMPKIGRFASEDIVKGIVELPYTLNPYTYCFNEPIRIYRPRW